MSRPTTSRRGRSSSTSCASWRSASPTSPATSTSTRRTTLTFREWDEQSNQAARWLVANGVAQGRPRRDRVAERVLPAVDRRVRRGAQGRRGRWCPRTRASRSPEMIAILGHAEISVMFTCAGLLEHARAVRGERAVAAVDRVRRRARRRHARLGRRDRRARPERLPGAGRRRRHGRHHVHVGHHRAAEGRARPAPQRRDDPELARRTGRAAVGCTARRCSRSRA